MLLFPRPLGRPGCVTIAITYRAASLGCESALTLQDLIAEPLSSLNSDLIQQEAGNQCVSNTSRQAGSKDEQAWAGA